MADERATDSRAFSFGCNRGAGMLFDADGVAEARKLVLLK